MLTVKAEDEEVGKVDKKFEDLVITGEKKSHVWDIRMP